MAPHTMFVSSSIFRGGLPGQRSSAALRAASKILSKTKKPPRVVRKRVVRKQPARGIVNVNEKKKALIADAILEAVAMEPRITRSRRSSVSSVESGSSVESASSRSSRSSVSSAGSTGSKGSLVTRVTRAANGVTKTRLRPRKVVVTSKKTKTAAAKARTPAKSTTSEKIRRERVIDNEVCFDELNWSSWKPAIAPVAMDKKYEWIERRGERPGVRNIDLFTNNCDRPAVYEFAVQTPAGDKKYPVLSRTTAGFTGSHWDTKLLNGLSVESQLDRVVKRGCKVFVRRALFSRPIKSKKTGQVTTVNELRSLMQKTYDYAWQEHYDVPSRKYFHRNVRKDGVVISDNPAEWM